MPGNREFEDLRYFATTAAKVAKGSIRKPKPVASKTSLRSPYEKIWTPVVGEDMLFILQTLREKFEQLGLKKIKPQTKCRKGKKSKKAKNSEGNDNVKEEQVLDTEAPKEEAPQQGWSQVDLRKHLALGINEVTRALEKNELYLAIVCKSAKPKMITKHIIELSHSREVPACQLPRLSENMAPVLGLHSVLALGFRRSSNVFQEQVKAIVPRVPPLYVPWLDIIRKKVKKRVSDIAEDEPQDEDEPQEEEKDEPQEEEKDEPQEEDSENTTPSRKRKLSPAAQPVEVTLQELKIKKIVPNPNKKRKVKVKKSKK